MRSGEGAVRATLLRALSLRSTEDMVSLIELARESICCMRARFLRISSMADRAFPPLGTSFCSFGHGAMPGVWQARRFDDGYPPAASSRLRLRCPYPWDSGTGAKPAYPDLPAAQTQPARPGEPSTHRSNGSRWWVPSRFAGGEEGRENPFRASGTTAGSRNDQRPHRGVEDLGPFHTHAQGGSSYSRNHHGVV